MKKRFFAVALALVLLAGAVAVGVHILNREAKAVVPYYVELFVDDGMISVPLEGADVKFWFAGQGWVQTTETSPGVYKVIRNDYTSSSWMARIDSPEVGEDIRCEIPDENQCTLPATITNFDWFTSWL